MKKVLNIVRLLPSKRMRIDRIVSDRLVAKVLEMYFLQIPSRMKVRPVNCVARKAKQGLEIVIFSQIADVEHLR